MSSGNTHAESLRQAALTVHALPDADRAWLLQSLSPLQRETLRPLLAELEELGIPRDPGLLPSIHREAAHRRAMAAWPESLDAAGIAALSRVLEREPAGVTRMLLAIHPWDWVDELPATLRQRALTLKSEASLAPALRESLIHALQEQVQKELGREPVATMASAPMSRWQRARTRFARFGEWA